MDSGQEWLTTSDSEMDTEVEYLVKTRNPFTQRIDGQDGGQDGGRGLQTVNRTKKRKYKSGSSGSSTSTPLSTFTGMSTDDKLTCIFQQMNRTYDKLDRVDSQQTQCTKEIKKINRRYSGLEERIETLEELCHTQMRASELLTYKSIEAEARSMRNNIVVYGLTENLRDSPARIVFGLLQTEMGIDTSEMYIVRAHRMGRVTDNRRNDPKRPMVVRFRDYVDTERIMRHVYKLKGKQFGIDKQYPKEISQARSVLYKSREYREAKVQRNRVHIKYPAQLEINGIVIRDMFPNWYRVLSADRLQTIGNHSGRQDPSTSRNRPDVHVRGYSHETIVDVEREREQIQQQRWVDEIERKENEGEDEVFVNKETSTVRSDRQNVNKHDTPTPVQTQERQPTQMETEALVHVQEDSLNLPETSKAPKKVNPLTTQNKSIGKKTIPKQKGKAK